MYVCVSLSYNYATITSFQIRQYVFPVTEPHSSCSQKCMLETVLLLLLLLLAIFKSWKPKKSKYPAIGRNWSWVSWKKEEEFVQLHTGPIHAYSASLFFYFLHLIIFAFLDFLLPHLTHSFCFLLTSLPLCESNCTSQFLSVYPFSPQTCFSLPRSPNFSSF